MTPARQPRPSRPRRAPRPDGTTTRLHILDVAGRVFAERGYAEATSKEICLRAGVNVAAVNYHFGSRDALYEAVLVEAHRQLVSLEDLTTLTEGARKPAMKLHAVLSHLAREAAALGQAPWGFRVILREVMAPSPHVPALVRKAIAPKAQLLRETLSAIMGLPPDHCAVQRALAFVMLPALAMLIVPPAFKRHVMPAPAGDPQALADDLHRHAMAGLAAMGRHYRADAPASKPARARPRRRDT